MAKLVPFTMPSTASSKHAQDGRLWLIAFSMSLVVNVVLLGVVLPRSTSLRPERQKPPEVSTVRTITILQDLAKATPSTSAAPSVVPASAPKYARTSDDQIAPRPDAPAFIGERNTQATSSRVPIQSAPPLPSQGGSPPRNPDHIETVESTYQDGTVSPPASPIAAPPAPPTATGALQKPLLQNKPPSAPPPPTQLAQGPNPVDVPVAKDATAKATTKSPLAELPKPEITPPPSKISRDSTPVRTSTPNKSTSFQGNQRKTAIVGSISRTGRSALNVVDSPLGRYQAIISRAVELEWQRNCTRHRDFITPGFLTVRFFVETSGRVRTVQFVGYMETGEVQKGFTLNAIRDAEIPKMPADLKKEFEKDPLELIFNFYF